MRRSSFLLLIVLAFVAAACSSDASEQLEGTWYWSQWDVYIEYTDDGQVSVADNSGLENPSEWGEYTFDGETLTVTTAPDSTICGDTSVTWTVEFSDDGDEASYTFVEDSCTKAHVRSQDIVWVRQSS